MPHDDVNISEDESAELGETIIDHIQASLKPDDVFTTEQLSQWALEHGFEVEDEDKDEEETPPTHDDINS